MHQLNGIHCYLRVHRALDPMISLGKYLMQKKSNTGDADDLHTEL